MPLMPRFLLVVVLALAGSGALVAQPKPEAPPAEAPAAPTRTLTQCEADVSTLETRLFAEMKEAANYKAAYADVLAQLRKLQREADAAKLPPK